MHGLVRRLDGWWWIRRRTLAEAVAKVLPGGGTVAVPGGQRVFDLFLALGYDVFHLTRAEDAWIGEGVALFSACREGESAEAVLARHGLAPGERRIIDERGPVSLTQWRLSSQPALMSRR